MPVRPVLFVLLAGMMLTACGGARPIAPVTDRSLGMRQPESEMRSVLHGDTLYSIAWESGRDYHDLAAWNGLVAPYTIAVGQQLRLYPPPKVALSTPPPTASVGEKKTSQPPAVSRSKPIKSAKKTAPTRAVTKPLKLPKPASAAVKPHKPVRKGHPTSHWSGAGVKSGWVWPASGKVLKNFDENGADKGLDIGGSKGQPIQAAAAGRVVYQGSGLRGYGQLIILKHNDEYLSAYAHNDRIYVKEGDTVTRGQKIAAMGDSGSDHVMLHFEIRRNGKPVDPLKYLPKR